MVRNYSNHWIDAPCAPRALRRIIERAGCIGRSIGEGCTMRIGQYIHISLYGRMERVLVLAIHRAGTIDVQRSNGACYRVSGL